MRGVHEPDAPSRGRLRRDRKRRSIVELAGWGRFPVIQGEECLSEDLEGISEGAVLSRGLGRSYGDASLPPPSGGRVMGTRLADRILRFDAETGLLRAEAGLSLRRLNRLFWPRGYCSPVSPGTQFVTLGGMVASDVHGKNHHTAGCFGEHVRALRMRVADGRVLEVTDEAEPALFRATLGGMGLTGHILEVEVALQRIPSPWIWRESYRVSNLEEMICELRDASRRWPYTVCWLDTAAPERSLGRGCLVAGRWAEPEEVLRASSFRLPEVSVPFLLPEQLVTPLTVRAFNQAIWMIHTGATKRGVVHPNGFFYPLDVLHDWNRLYGRSGFIQHQSVIPFEHASETVAKLLRALRAFEACAPLAVVKDCAAQGRGTLSFPRPGISLALDIPVRPERTAAVVRRLNEITIDAGGRIYLTKDALTEREHFFAMEPRLAAFAAVREKWDPERRIRSALSARLFGDAD